MVKVFLIRKVTLHFYHFDISNSVNTYNLIVFLKGWSNLSSRLLHTSIHYILTAVIGSSSFKRFCFNFYKVFNLSSILNPCYFTFSFLRKRKLFIVCNKSVFVFKKAKEHYSATTYSVMVSIFFNSTNWFLFSFIRFWGPCLYLDGIDSKVRLKLLH